MNLEEKFNRLILDLERHCKNVVYSSNIEDYLNCDAYKEIVNIGEKSLLYIYREMEKRESLELVWAPLMHSIVGEDLVIPENIRGKIKDLNSYIKRWLDWNLYKYIDIKKD